MLMNKQLPPDIEASNFRRRDFRIQPGKAALLVIDMQRFFLDRESHAFLPEGSEAIPRINGLIRAFRDRDWPVLFTRHIHPKGSDPGTMGKWWSDVMWDGSRYLEIHPSIELLTGDKVIQKQRYDVFLGTDLEEHLRSKGLTQVVITGVMTNLCCETTARTAFCKDFEVFFVHDCTATASEELHNSSLRNLAHGFAVLLSSQEVLEDLGVADGK
jgi:isochorismate hydrolase